MDARGCLCAEFGYSHVCGLKILFNPVVED